MRFVLNDLYLQLKTQIESSYSKRISQTVHFVSKELMPRQSFSQNVSFYMRIQYSRSKIAGRIYRE